jgi:hypothetical protein
MLSKPLSFCIFEWLSSLRRARNIWVMNKNETTTAMIGSNFLKKLDWLPRECHRANGECHLSQFETPGAFLSNKRLQNSAPEIRSKNGAVTVSLKTKMSF